MNTSSNEEKTILVVENEEVLADVLKQILETEGYHVETANNGTQALERIVDGIQGKRIVNGIQEVRSKIQLVLTDFNMGEMNGVQLVRNIRAMDSQIKIVMHSGKPWEAIEEAQRLDVAMPPMFKKPYVIKSLLKQIYDLFHPKKSAQQGQLPLSGHRH